MALFPSNLGGGIDWNLIGSETGSTAIQLPSSFKELLVIGQVGNLNIHFQFTIPRQFLSSTRKAFRQGYYATGGNAFIEVGATDSQISMLQAQSSGTNVLSTSSTMVYYR